MYCKYSECLNNKNIVSSNNFCCEMCEYDHDWNIFISNDYNRNIYKRCNNVYEIQFKRPYIRYTGLMKFVNMGVGDIPLQTRYSVISNRANELEISKILIRRKYLVKILDKYSLAVCPDILSIIMEYVTI